MTCSRRLSYKTPTLLPIIVSCARRDQSRTLLYMAGKLAGESHSESYSWLSTACRWPALWPMASEAPENRGSSMRYGHLIGCALKHVPDCSGATPTSPQVTYHSNFKTPTNTSKLQAPAIMLGQCCLAVNSHVKPCSMAANAASKPDGSPSSNGSPLSPSERLDCRLLETNGFLLSFPCCLSFLSISTSIVLLIIIQFLLRVALSLNLSITAFVLVCKCASSFVSLGALPFF